MSNNIVYKVDGARFSIRYFVLDGIQHISIEDIVRSLAYAESTIQRPNRRFKQEIDNGQVIKQQIAGSKKLEYWITLEGLTSFLSRSRKPKAIKQAFKDWIEHVVGLRYEQQEADLDQFISDTIDKAFAINEAASTTTISTKKVIQRKMNAALKKMKAERMKDKAEYMEWDMEWSKWHDEWVNKHITYDSWEDYYDESNTYWKEYAKWIWIYSQDPSLIEQHDLIEERKSKDITFKPLFKTSDDPEEVIKHMAQRVEDSQNHHRDLVRSYVRLVLKRIDFLSYVDDLKAKLVH